MYPAWSYQRELQMLNRQSEMGWQLIRGGNYFHRYKKNSDVQYRYQLDYTGKVEDMGRYIETFREQGWEYVNSTFNGWNFFRKPYDPALPEESYEIFTDRSSLREMTRRWIKLISILMVPLVFVWIINMVQFILTPYLPAFLRCIVLLLEILFFSFGILRMRKPEKGRIFQWDRTLFAVFLATAFVGLGTSIYLEVLRPHLNSMSSGEDMAAIPAEIEDAAMWGMFEIRYADNYYLDLSVTADSPICVSILDEAGSVVYTVTERSVDISNLKLQLQKGIYRIYFSDFEGGRLKTTFHVD